MFNGYIIKLFRHINREIYTADNNGFNFISWGCFDDIKITKVEDIVSYQKNNFKIDEYYPNNTSLFRQKILAYKMSASGGNIFENNVLPLISIHVLDCKFIKSFDLSELKSYLDDIVTKFKYSNFDFDVFDTFTLGRIIIVCRSDSFEKISVILAAIRRIPGILSSYSVYGISNENITGNGWNDEEIEACIKIRVKPGIYPTEVEKSLIQYLSTFDDPSGNAFILKDKIKVLTPGKYDFEVVLKTQNKQAFLKLFSSEGVYKLELNGKKIVIDTETVFFPNFSDEKYKKIKSVQAPIICDDDSICTTRYDECKKKWEKIYEDISKSSISEDYKYEIERLMLRALQLVFEYCSNGLTDFCDDITDGVSAFLKLTNETIGQVFKESEDEESTKEYCYYFDSIIDGSESLNVLLDNRDINDSYDFESPHSNVMFTIPISKLVLFYSKFSRNILKCMNKLNDSDNISIFVTVDGCSKITIHRLFENCEEAMLINIRIPVELLYHPFSTLAFITHELGHFSLTKIKESDRNQYFLASVLNFILFSLNDIDNLNYFDQSSALFIIQNSVCSKAELNLKAERYVALLKQAINNMIYFSTEKKDYATSNNLQKFIRDYPQYIDFINDSYTEALADAFMIKILGIEDPKKYIEILCHYLDHMSISRTDLSGNLILRFVAVFANMIKDVNLIDSAESLNNLCLKWISDNVTESDVCYDIFMSFKDMLQKKYFKYICYPLFCFLKYCVFYSLEEDINNKLLKEDDYKDFLKMYSSLSVSTNSTISDAFVDFIDYLCY